MCKHDNLYRYERVRRYECKAVRHLKEHIVADNEFRKVAVVAVVLVTACGPVNASLGLDERITARSPAASHGGTPPRQLIIKVAVTRRQLAEPMRSHGRLVLLIG